MAREKRFCKAEGCTNELDKRNVSGLCYTHYGRGQGSRISILRSYDSLRERENDVPRSMEIRIQEELFPRYRAWILETTPLESESPCYEAHHFLSLSNCHN